MDIHLIQDVALKGQLFFTDHAVRQMARRGIMDTEVKSILMTSTAPVA